MEEIFTALSNALNGSLALSASAAFAWGVLSLVLSPCHLASIPLIVGFIEDQKTQGAGRAAIMSVLFSAGILITIAAIGAITALAGRMMGDIGEYGTYFVGFVFIAVGLYLMGLLPFKLKGLNPANFKHRGLIAAFLLGLIFGAALGPCTFAYMAPMLAVVFANASQNFALSASLLFFYAIGHCIIIVAAGTFTGALQKYLNWNSNSSAAEVVKKICGALVLLGGLWILYS